MKAKPSLTNFLGRYRTKHFKLFVVMFQVFQYNAFLCVRSQSEKIREIDYFIVFKTRFNLSSFLILKKIVWLICNNCCNATIYTILKINFIRKTWKKRKTRKCHICGFAPQVWQSLFVIYLKLSWFT
jgi:hypothetical protein